MIQTPYMILEISPDSDDATIRRAYLSQIRRYPPERFPEEFQRIYAAYEQIQNEEARVAYQLFHHAPPSAAEIAELAWPRNTRGKDTGKRLSADAFRSQLHETINELSTKLKL